MLLFCFQQDLARHAAQLRYYRRVCRDMLGSEIGECVLYSLHSGETAELREE